MPSKPSPSADRGLIVEPGIQANVQIGRLDDSLRLQTQFIGCLSGKSVLITLPTHRSNEVQCYINDNLTLRYFHGREIHGFKSSVMAVVKAPYSYLHLSYPEHVEKVRIRSEPRLQAELPAQVRVIDEDESMTGRIIDINTQGARLRIPAAEVKVGDALKLQFQIPMGEKQEEVALEAEVRSARSADRNGEILTCGVAFRDLGESDRLLLSSYVYEMVLDQRLTSSEA